MEKIKVTQKQAEHIKYFERDRYYALEHKVNGTFSSSGCLDELSLDELAIALYVGYEVEEEFKVGDYVVANFDKNSKVREITDIFDLHTGGYSVLDIFDGEKSVNIELSVLRHATESEIVQEEARRTDKKLDDLLLNLSNKERVRLCNKLICLESDSDE